MKQAGGYFSFNEDDWFRERSSLNHDQLRHKIGRILTTDNEIYIKHAIAGKPKEVFSTPDEQRYYLGIKESIDAWSSVSDMMIKHAAKVFDKFKPYAQALRHMSEYLPGAVIEWLRAIVALDTIKRFELKEWVDTVNVDVKAVDHEFANFTSVALLKTAVDKLQDDYSERSFVK